MKSGKLVIFGLTLVVVALLWAAGQGRTQSTVSQGTGLTKQQAEQIVKERGSNKMTTAERKAAIKRARQLGLYPGAPVGVPKDPSLQRPDSQAVCKHERSQKDE